MKSEGTLLIELSSIQGKRLGREFSLLKEIHADELAVRKFSKELAEELNTIVHDNWTDDEEITSRYFNQMTETEKAVFI